MQELLTQPSGLPGQWPAIASGHSSSKSESFFRSFGTVIRYVRYVPEPQVILARNFLFALFISVIPALMPAVGLKALHLGPSQLGLLFTSMGAGSVIGAVFVISWLRARFSADSVALLGNLLIVLAYVLMAFIRQTELFLAVAAVAGVGWTLSASELWVAAQRAVPNWVRGRFNATVIMISQGAITLGSVIWGSAAAMVGVVSTLFTAAVLFMIALLLSRRLSINFARNPEERVSDVLSITEDPLGFPPRQHSQHCSPPKYFREEQFSVFAPELPDASLIEAEVAVPSRADEPMSGSLNKNS